MSGGRWENDGEGRELLRHSICLMSSFGLQPNDQQSPVCLLTKLSLEAAHLLDLGWVGLCHGPCLDSNVTMNP